MESDGEHFLAYYLVKDDASIKTLAEQRAQVPPDGDDDSSSPVRSHCMLSHVLLHGCSYSIQSFSLFVTMRLSRLNKISQMNFYWSSMMGMMLNLLICSGRRPLTTRTLNGRSMSRKNVLTYAMKYFCFEICT